MLRFRKLGNYKTATAVKLEFFTLPPSWLDEPPYPSVTEWIYCALGVTGSRKSCRQGSRGPSVVLVTQQRPLLHVIYGFFPLPKPCKPHTEINSLSSQSLVLSRVCSYNRKSFSANLRGINTSLVNKRSVCWADSCLFLHL